MKAMAFLPAIAATILALNISVASSQQACMKEFQGCMDRCTGKASKTVQDTCFQGCEGKNNTCAERVYGKRPTVAPAAAAAVVVDPAETKDALAPTDSKTENKVETQAADARDQANPKQLPPQPKQAPAKR